MSHETLSCIKLHCQSRFHQYRTVTNVPKWPSSLICSKVSSLQTVFISEHRQSFLTIYKQLGFISPSAPWLPILFSTTVNKDTRGSLKPILCTVVTSSSFINNPEKPTSGLPSSRTRMLSPYFRNGFPVTMVCSKLRH